MKRILIALAGLLAIVSCSIEPVETSLELLVQMTVTAEIQESSGKASLDGLEVYWSENDKVAVYDGSAVREFSVIAGAGTKKATLSGEVSSSATAFSAVYPYPAAVLNGGVLSVSAPEVQTISGFSSDENALVMSASAQKGEAFQFRNQAGLLRFSVPAGVTEVIILPGDGHMVTVNLPATAGSFEAALVPGSYQGIKVLAKSGGQWYVKSSDKAWTLERNHIIPLGELPLTDKALPIKTAEEMAGFLLSATANDKRTVLILNDISLKSQNYLSATDFSGSLDGLGHTVSSVDKPLFSSSHGNLSNLVVSGTCSTSELECAPLAVRNYGTITNVTNNAAVAVTAADAVSNPLVLGGIAAYNYGSISNCVNDGTVSFTGGASVKATAIGGIAGYSEGPLNNCNNAAAVSLSFKYGGGMTALGSITVSAANLGGIVGAGWEGFSVTDCTNSGVLTYLNGNIENTTEKYQRVEIGGIAGAPYGDITRCRNSARMNISAVTSSRAAFSTVNYILQVGGISGGSFHESATGTYTDPNDHTSIIDCINEGDLAIEMDATASNSPIGGIVGWPNGEHATLNNTIRDCENKGNITMNGGGKVRIGGICGGTGTCESCTNSGNITLKSANSKSSIGGIAGFHSQDHMMTSCSNTGDVVSQVVIDAVGGLIGTYGNVSHTSGLSCSVDCLVKNAESQNSGTGIVLGRFNGTSGAAVLGTEQSPIDVKGTVEFGSTSVIIDENNFNTYLSGTYNAAAVHIIYAVCTVPGKDPYYAEGYLTYDGSEPAAGVSVSDGFRVAVTDANGYYKLVTSSDTRYIYVSYPADAKIEKHTDGTPAFFTKYDLATKRYDFNFKRQEVENEFMIFAMADPQAHNSARGSGTGKQKTADTNRFRDEAVPAINTQIAAQTLPCYGITLGDIVYSEGSRNSNGGMTTMRTHFKGVNMPVFQTMGNHDFTYFYTSKPLTTDTSSSTLYLAAQRKFEDTFGPVNLSFNRGSVHFVCMRNIIFDSNTNAASYHGGFTDAQYSWLQQDLANVPKDKMVVVCVHIPFVGILSNEHVKDVLNLIKQYASAKVFSGHTHYKRYATNLNSSGVHEHIHSAVCGQWWWSNIEGDGCPNGYTVYKFSGTGMTDEYFIGQNNHMNTRDYQMRIYRGNLKNGGQYAYFQWPHAASKLMINVFNGDSRWTVKVYENGTYSGKASLVSYSRKTYASVTAGETYTVPTSSSQDWWAIGYHIGVLGRGTTSESYYTSMFHMFTYTLKDANASVKVVATDGYGNTYECSDIIETNCWYPDYVVAGNAN